MMRKIQYKLPLKRNTLKESLFEATMLDFEELATYLQVATKMHGG